MEQLKSQRRVIKANITRIYNYCSSPDSSSDQIQVRGENLDRYFQSFEEIQNAIEAEAATSEQASEQEEYRIQVEETYYAAKTIIRQNQQNINRNLEMVDNSGQTNQQLATVINTMTQNQINMGTLLERLSTNSSTPISHSNSEALAQQTLVKLPSIHLPEFDGAFTNWIRFRDLFETLIHNRSSLSNIERFEYLQAHVKGDALATIKHLNLSNDNYTVAWDLIKAKYNNSTQIKNSYLKLLFDQPPMKGPNASELKRLLNNINEGINALKALDEAVDHWTSILLFNLERKLDPESQTLWCRFSTDGATLTSFLKFLEQRQRELEIYNNNNKLINNQQSNRPWRSTSIHTANMKLCPVCQQKHLLFSCDKFKALNINERIRVVRDNNICFNCLQNDHRASECKRSACKKCQAKHNTLLHREDQPNKSSPETSPVVNKINVNSVNTKGNKLTLLPTAVGLIKGANNEFYPVRMLLDTGAQATLISESCVQRLNLKKLYDKTLLCCVGEKGSNYTRGKVEILLKSSTSNNTIRTSALCVHRLTQLQPAVEVSAIQLEYFRNLTLADPNCNKPNQIDIIVGANLFNEYFLNQHIVHPTDALSAFNTVFGWVIISDVSVKQITSITIAHTSLDLSDQLQQFWKIEELQEDKEYLTEEEQQAETFYQKTVTRDESGRYTVRLPFKTSNPDFGDTRKQAIRRMCNMEARLINNKTLHEQYTKFMEEYLILNHMEEIPNTENVRYHLPHHSVIKMDSSTTKLRVVFDGSAKGTNGTSLNQQLLIGPTIQNDIFTILLQFRKYKIGLTSDIEKMYRQVLIHPEDRVYQCIVWRTDSKKEISTYQLKTITYGTAAAPFLAVRTLKQIAIEMQQEKPEISNVIMQCFYVDDFMFSTNDEQTAVTIKNELCKVLSQAGFHLRKWCSNSNKVLETIDVHDRELSVETVIDDTQTVKTLGLYWNTYSDTFKYSVKLPIQNCQITKRVVLSIIARVFDPLGWIAPVVIIFKIFLQKLWLKGIEWDSPLPIDLHQQWQSIYENIRMVSDLEIPRWLQYSNESSVELHGFADSSELAYSAVIYLKVIHDNGKITTRLVASKTRVAPVKQVTLPRLELCACQLLVKLIVKVKKAMQIKDLVVHGWSDSTIVLAWLAEHPRKWKSFVANRTSYIISILPSENWHHIPSKMNPADLATRGLNPKELQEANLWWNGPTILENNNYSQHISDKTLITDLEIRKTGIFYIDTSQKHDIFYKYSTFSKLVRITATILRFIRNCKTKNTKKTGFLTTIELQNAHDTLIKRSQQTSYTNEYQLLSKGNQLHPSHKLSALTPFVDVNGLIRVGGRLAQANIPYNQKHPLILHKDNVLTDLIVCHYHLKFLHAGSRQLQYLLGLKYCIPSVVYVIKRCVYKCPTCMRYRNKPVQQQMGNLPKPRVEAITAFHNTGIDFAGPIIVRSWKGRGSRNYKCWIAVFVCLATKAMHLELVTELTSDAFIATLRRFVARRGKPAHLYSDNGTNFVGCNNKLKDLVQFIHEKDTQEAVTRETSEKGIHWHFSPPFGPNFGGIWEAGVKSVKYYLNRILGNSAVTYEELTTILCQIESCLNSRPLCANFKDDADPLTPAHFLIFKSMETVPEENFTNININRLSRWQYLQQLVQKFW